MEVGICLRTAQLSVVMQLSIVSCLHNQPSGSPTVLLPAGATERRSLAIARGKENVNS